jgi:predicted O-methyltransferase YrrM
VQSLLHFVRWRLGLDAAEQWMAPEESACLISHARGKKRLAEIGVWEGGTTRRLREVMAPDATIHAIDPYPPGRSGISYQKLIAAGEVAAVSNGRVVWLRQTGAEAAQNRSVLEAPFDFVFVDGDHTYEGLRRDWEGWSPLVAPGGIVALHDSLLPEGHLDAGSVRYSNEVPAHDPRFETVDEVASLRVLRRLAASQLNATQLNATR